MPLLIVLGGAVLLLDQVTKLLVASALPLHSVHEVIPGFFNLVHIRNPGAAFSILAEAGAAWRHGLLVGLTLFVLAIILFAYGKLPASDRRTRTAYSLITGGALGNLVDRVRMGEVTDFLDVHIGSAHWPAFNLADSAISVGALLLVVSLFRGK